MYDDKCKKHDFSALKASGKALNSYFRVFKCNY